MFIKVLSYDDETIFSIKRKRKKKKKKKKKNFPSDVVIREAVNIWKHHVVLPLYSMVCTDKGYRNRRPNETEDKRKKALQLTVFSGVGVVGKREWGCHHQPMSTQKSRFRLVLTKYITLNRFFITKSVYHPLTCVNISLRKHAYSNILKISPPKTEFFQIKNSDIFHISVQNINCGYSLEPPQRGGSNEYSQSMFLSKDKKIMFTPVNPNFTI